MREYTSTMAARDFNLLHTFASAQPLSFIGHYDAERNSLSYSYDNETVRVFQGEDSLRISGSSPRCAKEITKRFRLGDSMESVYSEISKDDSVAESVRRYRGLRLTLNDPWESTIVFIISQFNNVKRIRRITQSVMERFGSSVGSLMSFPAMDALAEASERDLLSCNAGFRAKYIKGAAEYCRSSLDLYGLRGKGYDTIKESLLEIPGVGDKVADCIALMGYGELEAFPIDTWVKRTMERRYFDGKSTSIKRLHEFAYKYWGNMSGYAQLYVFHGGRMEGRSHGR